MNATRRLSSVFLVLLCANAGQPARAEWTRCGPSDALHVEFLAVDPRDPRTIYATGEFGPNAGSDVAWKTTDGGDTWRRLDLGVGANSPRRIAIDPANPQTLYLTSDTRVLRSMDAGASWSETGRIAESAPRVAPFALAIDPASPNVLYVSAASQGLHRVGGVFKSTDRGASWKSPPGGLSRFTVHDLLAVRGAPSRLYAAESHGFFRSKDDGKSWSAVGPEGVKARFMSAAVDPQDPRVIYVGTAGAGIFKTTDGCRTWTAANQGLAHPAVYALAIDPVNSQVVWAGTSGGGVFRSADGGKSWVESNDGSPARFIRSLVIAPIKMSGVRSRQDLTPIIYIGTTRYGVLRRTGEPARRNTER